MSDFSPEQKRAYSIERSRQEAYGKAMAKAKTNDYVLKRIATRIARGGITTDDYNAVQEWAKTGDAHLLELLSGITEIENYLYKKAEDDGELDVDRLMAIQHLRINAERVKNQGRKDQAQARKADIDTVNKLMRNGFVGDLKREGIVPIKIVSEDNS